MIRALPCLALAGCAIGAGGSTVGEWRPKRVVESTACIETAPGVCGKVIEIGREQPARSFGGGIFQFAVPGYAQSRSGGDAEHAFVLGGSYEYLRGRGRFAVGGRVGLDLLLGQDHSWTTLPVTAMGYYGGGWGAVFIGAGYSPFLAEKRDGTTTYHHDGIIGLVGTRIVLRESLHRYITVSPELSAQRAGAASILSLTANLGVHF